MRRLSDFRENSKRESQTYNRPLFSGILCRSSGRSFGRRQSFVQTLQEWPPDCHSAIRERGLPRWTLPIPVSLKIVEFDNPEMKKYWKIMVTIKFPDPYLPELDRFKKANEAITR